MQSTLASVVNAEHGVARGRGMTICFYLFVVVIIVISTYKATIDLQTVYVIEEEDWKTNQWWWDICKQPDFAQNIAKHSSKCIETQYQSHSDVLWRAMYIVTGRYWVKMLYILKVINNTLMICVRNQSTLLILPFITLLIVLVAVRFCQRHRKSPVYAPRMMGRGAWLSPRQYERNIGEPSYFQRPSHMDRVLIHRRGNGQSTATGHPQVRIV